MEKTTLEVGDKILCENAFMKMEVEIDRVTKTSAISKPYNKQGALYRFDRTLPVRLKPTPKWNTTEYTLIK